MPRDERVATDPTCRVEVRHKGLFERPWCWVVDRPQESSRKATHHKVSTLTLTRRMIRTVFATIMMVMVMMVMIGVEREEQSSVPQEEASRIGEAEFCYRTFSFGIICRFQPFPSGE